MKKNLYNKKNKQDLIKEIDKENFNRLTYSFYRYTKLKNINVLRDNLYFEWSKLKILGRIYLSEEGINAQISIPEYNIDLFKMQLNKYSAFKDILFKTAVQEGQSFLKLVIKIKNEIVAYNIDKSEYNMDVTGKHLDSSEFNKAIKNGATIVDMRNYYEGEIGKFENAIIPDVDTSKKLLPEVKKLLKGQKNNKILLYCTGGIRCEKASSYLIHHGFSDVNQLKGGIIQYANDVKKQKLTSKFIGKNYVFDHRMGERITKDIISKCHQCESSSDSHTNCLNQACHILFIQCTKCAKIYNNCCSEKCKEFLTLPKEEQKKLFKQNKIQFSAQLSKKIKPKLKDLKKHN